MQPIVITLDYGMALNVRSVIEGRIAELKQHEKNRPDIAHVFEAMRRRYQETLKQFPAS